MDDHSTSSEVAAGGSTTPSRRRTWQEIASEIVFLLPNVGKLLVRLVRDSRVPIRHKVLAASVAAYIAAPIDLIPDFVVGLGRLDDAVLAALALSRLIEGAGHEVVLEHWDGSEDSLDLLLATVEWGAGVFPTRRDRRVPSAHHQAPQRPADRIG